MVVQLHDECLDPIKTVNSCVFCVFSTVIDGVHRTVTTTFPRVTRPWSMYPGSRSWRMRVGTTTHDELTGTNQCLASRWGGGGSNKVSTVFYDKSSRFSGMISANRWTALVQSSLVGVKVICEHFCCCGSFWFPLGRHGSVVSFSLQVRCASLLSRSTCRWQKRHILTNLSLKQGSSGPAKCALIQQQESRRTYSTAVSRVVIHLN